jgi:hypothetical protein
MKIDRRVVRPLLCSVALLSIAVAIACSNTAKTGAVINGRILAGAITPGTIALDTNTVNVTAP